MPGERAYRDREPISPHTSLKCDIGTPIQAAKAETVASAFPTEDCPGYVGHVVPPKGKNVPGRTGYSRMEKGLFQTTSRTPNCLCG